MSDRIELEIVEKLGFTEETFEQRKHFMLLSDEAIALLKEFASHIEELPDDPFDSFYDHLREFDETRDLLRDDATIARLKQKQKQYFKEMISGEYGFDYLLKRLKVGYRHVQFDIDPMWYIGSFSKYLSEIQTVAKSIFGHDPEKLLKVNNVLQRITMLDIVITLEGYHYIKYELQELLQNESRIDELTGAFNRRKFDETLENEIRRFNQYRHPFSIISLDLDSLGTVNDAFGREAGDTVLKEFCFVANSCLKEVDMLFRYGGEGFMILLPSQRIIEARMVAERIRSATEEYAYPHGRPVTASFGVTEFGIDDNSLSLIKRADAALYEAKKEGKNAVVLA